MNNFTRRDFMKASAAFSLAAMTTPMNKVFAAGSDKLRIGLIGCGGRGTGAVGDCIKAADNVEIYAMADLFKDRIDNAINLMKVGSDWIQKVEDPSKINITEERCFSGFDAFQKLLAIDEIDIVILATPPGFRPQHFEAAINAGKHVFMEKPVAVDPFGVRSIIKTAELADQKKLCVVAGTQRRHQKHYIEIMKRIHDGDIGEIVAAQCYWNGGGMLNWGPANNPQWSEMERQCRRWYFYDWICGDHIVEQHVHNLDVVNWAFNGIPEKCLGIGGRQVRTAPEYGNIYDHFTVEYEYPNGAKITSMCRQFDGCTENVSERIVGTKGVAYLDGATGKITGDKPFEPVEASPNPYVIEHADLIAAIRNNEHINEGKRVAESTLTAIAGRMSTYTGRALKLSWALNASTLNLTPEKYEFGPMKTNPVPMPGITQ
ncbi:MAG TPA: Gfo/Idh/MocA family oxidoreductase, partial [Sedimentisphaerales bacterium]|nr:Gfo/Idh/MocA family oxidoreductase [Sedimentisphaerales bacterium]